MVNVCWSVKHTFFNECFHVHYLSVGRMGYVQAFLMIAFSFIDDRETQEISS